MEEEQRQREELRDQLNTAERRAQILQSEKEDLAIGYEQVCRYYKLILILFRSFRLQKFEFVP